jgi:uncharacterized phage protein gp47/JayE
VAYFAPYIDDTGFHTPTYEDIRDHLIARFQAIFGVDVYLRNDSQDYQWISAVASLAFDKNLLLQQVYNNRGPATATRNGLDGIVAINGIRRKPATYSTALVTLEGDAGSIVYNGVISDGTYKWSLPSMVQIGQEGDVTATCQTPGPILAAAGALTKIDTPALGWQSVTNPAPAEPGFAIESQSALRARQAYSVAQPSQSILDGLRGAIADIYGVNRSKVYENDTSDTDALGLPAHSVTAVVEGGADQGIAQALYMHKTPGCYTNGSVAVVIPDAHNQANIMRFYRPSAVSIGVKVAVKPLVGYTTETTAKIRRSVYAYLTELTIGDTLTISALWGVALAVMPDVRQPTFSITGVTAQRQGGSWTANDISLGYKEMFVPDENQITVSLPA